MKYELKTVGVWAFVKVSFFINLALGFLFGLFYAIIIFPLLSLLGGMAGMEGARFAELPSVGVMVFILPILFALFGAVFNTIIGLVVAGVYNLAAKLVGGLEFEFAPVVDMAPMQPPAQPVTTPPVPPQAPPPTSTMYASEPTERPRHNPQPPAPPPLPVVSQIAPQEEMRPENLAETPPVAQEPDEDGPFPDET